MATFTWRERLKISIGEMSRTAAIETARDFNPIFALFSSDQEMLTELETLVATRSPARIVFDDQPVSADAVLDINGDILKFPVPLTREAFNALPYSLTTKWIEAAIEANSWVVEDLKNAISRAATKTSEPQSGSAPLQEQTTQPLLIPTSGN